MMSTLTAAPAAIHPCARCATLQKTCCQRAEVLVTPGDVQRIRAQTGERDFTQRRAPSEPSYLDQDDDPNWSRWTIQADGTRVVLRRRPDGDCHFLTPEGCGLPLEVRPLVCRLYPFEYTEAGLGQAAGEYCPSQVVPSGRTILQVLDMREADARRWHRMLYDELREASGTR